MCAHTYHHQLPSVTISHQVEVAFSASTWEEEAGRSQRSNPAWPTEQVPRQLLQLECTSTYFLLTNQAFVLAAVHAVAQGKGLHNFFYHLIHELQMSWILSHLVENNSKEEELCLPSLSPLWTLWMITQALSMRDIKGKFKLTETHAVHYRIWFHMFVYSLSKYFFFQRVKELNVVHVCQN